MPKLLVSVVIPCYNEEAVITSTLNRINDVVNNLTAYEFELIVVNDGSSDSTRVIVEDLVMHDKKIKLLNLTRN